MSVIPVKVRDLVLKRDHYRCVINGPGCTVTATVADHRANRAMGGSRILNDPANLIASCILCNGEKENAHGDRLVELKRRGVRVIPDSTHAKTLLRAQITPVEYPDGTVALLTSSGLRLVQVQILADRSAS